MLSHLGHVGTHGMAIPKTRNMPFRIILTAMAASSKLASFDSVLGPAFPSTELIAPDNVNAGTKVRRVAAENCGA